ncbi:MAG: ABC transporter permease, partial [Actinomycetota bacterium]|nr:ABC transporter permease [Actinomycetota bacterium]
IFVPGSNLVEEKEQGTLMAMLVTPARIADVLTAMWMLGTLLASVMAAATLLLNQALGSNWLQVFVVVLVAAGLSSMIGLLIGTFAKDSAMMFGLVKGLGIFLFAPTLFYIFPDWPQWIAKLFPLYWILEPIWRVSIMGGSISEVWIELTVAVGITLALIPVIGLVARRVQSQMAAQ